MISLCMSVLCSSLVSIVMRLSTNRIRHNLGMLTMNYIVCALLAGLFGGFRGAFDLSDPQVGLTLAMGSVNGVLYLAGFVLMQLNIRKKYIENCLTNYKYGQNKCRVSPSNSAHIFPPHIIYDYQYMLKFA